MRPGRKGPGNGSCDSHGQREVVAASMRPGRKGPGNGAGFGASSGFCRCFNEAGAQRPRKRPIRSIRAPRLWGFNEAGAQRPRKRGVGHLREQDLKGFNEAGAQRPRKHPRACGERSSNPTGFNEAGAQRPRKRGGRFRRIRVSAASMRPGRKGPGNRNTPAMEGAATSSFNEAGAQRPRKPLDQALPFILEQWLLQ